MHLFLSPHRCIFASCTHTRTLVQSVWLRIAVSHIFSHTSVGSYVIVELCGCDHESARTIQGALLKSHLYVCYNCQWVTILWQSACAVCFLLCDCTPILSCVEKANSSTQTMQEVLSISWPEPVGVSRKWKCNRWWAGVIWSLGSHRSDSPDCWKPEM